MNKKKFLEFIDEFAQKVLSSQNKDGSFGRFKAINDQFPVYTLAMLYKNSSSRYFNDSTVKKSITACLRHRLKSMDEYGRLEFITPSGENLGFVNHDWSHFALLETLFYFQNEIPKKLHGDLLDKLKIALKEHYKETKQKLTVLKKSGDKKVHNLLVWKSLLLYRAGGLLDNKSWLSFAEESLRFFISHQNKEGWWSEGGPITVYNYVTATAISLYYEYSGDKSAGKSMERALSYHMSTTYPDMKNIETIDSRVRYKGIGPYLPPSFSRYADGGKFLNSLIEALRGYLTGTELQLFSFLGFTYDYAHDKPVSAKNVKREQFLPAAAFACVRKSDWCVTACGAESEWVNSRFRLDRQNLISVWHKKLGLIIGGGHSKFQPEFSLFNIFDDTHSVKHIHDKAVVKQDKNGIDLKLWYGSVKVGMRIRILNSRKLSITYLCDVPDNKFAQQLVRHRLIFLSKLGEKLSGKSARVVLKNEFLNWTMEDHGNIIKHNGWTLTIPDGEHLQTKVQWPVNPFNSYRLDAKSDPAQAALMVTTDFNMLNKEVEYILEIN